MSLVSLNPETKKYMRRAIENDLSNATDNVLRARRQQERMPFDHDNNDALLRYEAWEFKAKNALKALEAL